MSSVVDTSQLSEVISSFSDAVEDALKGADTIACEQVESRLNEIDGYVREIQQAMWADEAECTMERLENGEPLNETDRDVIRTFLVSDAEHYLANENNFGDWVNEMRRLVADMQQRAANVSRDDIGSLRGIIKDAVRLFPDIRNFMEERKRVERCDLAVGDLDMATRRTLVKIIREQLYSPTR
ncbi:MAG: hypothetical protein ACYTHJ_02340 [Planctomycetota bacterium]|jgi:hypothetical protein